jgi:hypothetical protein
LTQFAEELENEGDALVSAPVRFGAGLRHPAAPHRIVHLLREDLERIPKIARRRTVDPPVARMRAGRLW